MAVRIGVTMGASLKGCVLLWRLQVWRRGALGLLAMAGLSLALTGCGKKQTPALTLTPLPEDAVILIYASGIGDKADFFRSTEMDEVLFKAMKRKIVSMGQPGEFAEDALKRLPEVLREYDPELMVLGYGAMDVWKNTDRAKLKASLCAMIDLAHKQDTQVIMLSLPDLNKVLLRPDPIFEEVAREKNVPIDTEIVSSVLKKPSERVFRYMVNDKGLKAIAEAVRALCVRCGGLAK